MVNHEIIRRDRNRNGGGVALHIHKSISYTNRNDLLCDLEICTVQLNIHYVKSILVSSVYHPPDSKVECFDRLDKFISKIEEKGKEFTITRDMNCDIFKPKDNDTKHLKKVYADHHLNLVIAEPTRVISDTRTHLIDHIATNKPEYISKSMVIACGISDHQLAIVNRNMRIPKIKKDPETIDIRKLKSFDSIAFLEELKSKYFDAIKDITRKPNEMWVIWKSLCLDVLNKHALLSKIRVKGNNLPYVTTEVR